MTDNQGGIAFGHFPTDSVMNRQNIKEGTLKPSFEIEQFFGKKFSGYADTKWQAQ